MPSKILITGGTGLVGRKLTTLLQSSGHEVSWLSRTENASTPARTFRWSPAAGFIEPQALRVNHIIHLAGAGVADGKWTNARKKLIYDSRVSSTKLLFRKVKEQGVPLKSFISASAIGCYGFDTGDRLLDERVPSGSDFLAEVVKNWELASDEFQTLNIPVIKIRIGIVLDKDGGALPKIAAPVKLGLGAPLGKGTQYMSWIHVNDLTRIFEWALTRTRSEVYNAVAPQPVRNREMTKTIARVLSKPMFLPAIPAFVLKLMLGEMAGMVLGGNNVSSEKLVQAGFNFEFEDLTTALRNLISVNSTAD